MHLQKCHVEGDRKGKHKATGQIELMARDLFRSREEFCSYTVLLKFEHGSMKVCNLEICCDNLSIEIIGL